MWSWLSKQCVWQSPEGGRRQRGAPRLGVEPLEDRTVPTLFIPGSTGEDIVLVERDKVVVTTPSGTSSWDISTESSVQIDTLNGNDRVQVNGVAPGRFVGIDTGKEDDTVEVCPNTQDLGYIQGYLGLGGGYGYDRLILSDRAWNGGDTYTITAQTIRVAGLPGFTVGYGGFEDIELTTGGGNDTVRVESTAPNATYFIGTGAGNDLVRIESVAGGTTYFVDTGDDRDTFQHVVGFGANWLLTGLNQGTVLGWGSFVSAENLTSGAGNDTFYFNAGSGVTGVIDGGAGADGLNYLGNFPGAFATIPSGPATATGGVTNFEWWAA
jgi:hypothetical protein